MPVTREQAEVLTAAEQEQLPEVQLLRPQPGDVVVVRLSSGMSAQDFEHVADRLSAQFEDTGIKVVLIGPDAELSVVRQDGA